jgi:hypothetical protein
MGTGTATRYEAQVPLSVVPSGWVASQQPLEVVDQGGETEHTGTALSG